MSSSLQENKLWIHFNLLVPSDWSPETDMNEPCPRHRAVCSVLYLGFLDLDGDDLFPLTDDLHQFITLLHQLGLVHGRVHLEKYRNTDSMTKWSLARIPNFEHGQY